MNSKTESQAALGRYPLWALMAAPVAVGVLLALGRLLEAYRDAFGLASAAPHTLPTEWALVLDIAALALMVSFAARRGCLRALLRSGESPFWYGGTLIFAAGFFRIADIMGANVSHYGYITWNWGWSGLPTLLIVWPMLYGALAAAMTYLTIVVGAPSSYRWRWILTGIFLTAIATATFFFAFRAVPWADDGPRTSALYSMGLVLTLIALTVAFVPGDRRKTYLMDLIATLWFFFGLIQTGDDILHRAGPGFWLQSLGMVMILIAAIVLLALSRIGTRQVLE